MAATTAGERGNGLFGWDHRFAVSHFAEVLARVAAWLGARADAAPDSEADAWGPRRARLAELTHGIEGLAGELGYNPAGDPAPVTIAA